MLYKDLGKLVEIWKELNEYIIIGIDANEGVRKSQTNQFFKNIT